MGEPAIAIDAKSQVSGVNAHWCRANRADSKSALTWSSFDSTGGSVAGTGVVVAGGSVKGGAVSAVVVGPAVVGGTVGATGWVVGGGGSVVVGPVADVTTLVPRSRPPERPSLEHDTNIDTVIDTATAVRQPPTTRSATRLAHIHIRPSSRTTRPTECSRSPTLENKFRPGTSSDTCTLGVNDSSTDPSAGQPGSRAARQPGQRAAGAEGSRGRGQPGQPGSRDSRAAGQSGNRAAGSGQQADPPAPPTGA